MVADFAGYCSTSLGENRTCPSAVLARCSTGFCDTSRNASSQNCYCCSEVSTEWVRKGIKQSARVSIESRVLIGGQLPGRARSALLGLGNMQPLCLQQETMHTWKAGCPYSYFASSFIAINTYFTYVGLDQCGRSRHDALHGDSFAKKSVHVLLKCTYINNWACW